MGSPLYVYSISNRIYQNTRLDQYSSGRITVIQRHSYQFMVRESMRIVNLSSSPLLAPQSGAHTIAPHRDPIQPIPNPIQSNPLIALEQENPEKTYDVIYF